MSVQRTSFYILLVLVTLGFIGVILPFYSAVFWAMVFAILFFPLHCWIEDRLGGRRSLAAIFSVCICLFLVIVPGLLILGSLFQEGNKLYQQISSGQIDLPGMVKKVQDSLPDFVRDRIDALDAQGLENIARRLSSSLMQGSSFFAGRAWNFGQNTLQFFVVFGVMIYLLFFLFRDGRMLGRKIMEAIPLSASHTRRFTEKFTSVVRATVRGNIIIAVVQGVIGGVTFWFLGIEPALLFGVLMMFMSLLPAVGAAIVWGPIALYLAISGSYASAIILVAVGVVVIGLVDNLLRPPLVGKETKMPDYVVLISTIGGISLLGINGFVIGPVIAALFIAAWTIFIEERDRDEASAKPLIIEKRL